MNYNIAIDGPAGAGKSTIAKELAKRLGFIYVDTGAMYRAMALFFIRKNLKEEEEEKISGSLGEITVEIAYSNGEQQVILNGENVTPYLRTEPVSRMTSVSSAYKSVRAKLLNLQRELAAKSNVVMDGRDIGTCVLPDADLKIYLTASVDARAMRRYLEYQDKGNQASLKEIKDNIEERDYRDMHREAAPLRQAEMRCFWTVPNCPWKRSWIRFGSFCRNP